MREKKKMGRKLLSFLLTVTMVIGLMPGMSLTAYAASEVTEANVKCSQYSYMEADNAGLQEITNITLDEAQAFGAAVSCPTTYWMVVYAKDGNNLKWTSNSNKTGEQTSTSWDNFIYNDAFICPDPWKDVTIYFSKGLATISVTGVTLNPTSTTLTAGGDAVALTAAVSPNDATDKTVKWSVGGNDAGAVKLYSDEACTTEVDTDAIETLTVYAKGISAGSATVTATSNADSTKSASCDVTVNAAAPSKLTLNVEENGKVVMSSGIYGNGADGFMDLTRNIDFKGTMIIADDHCIKVHEGANLNILNPGKISFYPAADNTGTITAIPDDGYTFTGWYNGETLYSGVAELDYKNISEDLTLTAKFEAAASHTHDDITFTAWTSADSLPTEAGSYYLTQDVTLTGFTWTQQTNGAINLCLNGYSITGNQYSTEVLDIGSGVTLNLYDCAGDPGHISKHASSMYYQYGVNVHDGGSFTMNGGSITGNDTGVSVVEGSFTMNGGSITGNTSNVAGGGVVAGYDSSFTMNGGSIVSNTSRGKGGGVYAYYGTFTMNGGSITGNNAGDNGGGVCIEGYSTKFSISGSPVIRDNTSNSTANNIYLDSNINNMVVTGELSLPENANAPQLGVTLGSNHNGTFTKGYKGYNGTTDPASFFFDDKNQPGYGILLYQDDEAALMPCYTISISPTTGGTVTANKTKAAAWDSITLTVTPDDGYALSSLQYKYTDYNGRETSEDISDNWFSMPRSNVTVVAVFSTHIHDFTYSETGDTITATCSADDCTLDDGTDQHGHAVTLTIVKPALTNWIEIRDGSEKATLSGLEAFTSATGQAIAATQIKYVGRDGTTYAESATAPLAAGKYTAGITLAGVKTSEGEDKSVSASVDYEIAKRDQSVNPPTAYADLIYDKTSHALLSLQASVSEGNVNDTVRYSLDNGENWYAYEEIPQIKDAGTYTVLYKVPGNDMYNDFSSSIEVIIAKAQQEVTAPEGHSDLIYNSYEQDLLRSKPVVVNGNARDSIQYKVDNGEWMDLLPYAVNAGEYTVYYRVPANGNYNAYEDRIQVSIAKADPVAPTGLTATYGQTLADVTLPEGWTWSDSTTDVGVAGTHSFKANCSPTDTANYDPISDVDVNVTVSPADPIANAPTGLTATYGQTLADVTLTNPEGNTPGTWEFVDAGTTSVGNAGVHTFQVKFTPTDAVNYNTLSNVDVTVTVSKADQTAPAAPTKANATTNSITLTAIENGEYKCDDGEWQTSPTFTGLAMDKSYSFRQRYAADENHNVSNSSNETAIRTSRHSHEWDYAADGATITATCVDSDGGHGETKTATLTLKAPTLTTYGGDGIAEATIEGSIEGVVNPSIMYKKGSETLTSAPTAAGTYTASITIEDATASVEYTIAKRPVAVSGITAGNKIYDGNTTATLVTTAAIFEGKLAGDTLTVSATGTFENANVSENKAVTISGLTLGGNDKDNYVLAAGGQQTGTTATITAKEVGLEWSNTELTYNGLTQAPTATATGLVSGDTCTVTVSGEQANVGDNYTATASSLSNSNYKLPKNKTTTFKISKANAIAATVTANNRTYDGTEKPLATVTGETTGGTLKFAVTTENQEPNTEAYTFDTTSIPTATDAGTYYVWYKVVGDETHIDTEPVCVPVKIRAAIGQTVIFKVINGAWNDGTTEDITVDLSGFEGDVLKLSADEIPSAGTKPDSDHKKGSWDTIPSTDTEITKDTTYTYTYADKEMITFTVTFKVKNGEWDDGGSADKTVTLSREIDEDLALIMKEGDIPAVGNKPSNGFKAGEWDVTPTPDILVSEDKVYTYTYAQKESISSTVTFKVENGTWNDGTTEDKTVILSGYEGDALKLAAGDIPAVGEKPDTNYKEGAWDIIPSDATEITADTVYTYKYVGKTAKSNTVTFKVENGTWNDGTTEDKTVILSGYEGDALKLAAGDIPAVGEKPDTNYKEGAWNVIPSTDTEITADTTYTYTYAEKSIVSHTVTFKVENGSWNDGTADDITVTLSGYEDEILKLADGQIPAVGAMPGENKKEGSWDTVPDMETAITDDITCTYRYNDKDAISVKVTFKVVNGSWNDGTALDKIVTISGYEGDSLMLTSDQIPLAGDKPSDTYKAGGWDAVPEADTELTTDVTYTYGYIKKDTVTYTAAFKVENGTWNDGTADDIIITLTGYEGDTLKFTSDDIPEAGEKPAETYKAGEWDTAFSAENVLTADTTYTYTYKEKSKISQIVTFKVVNGSWNDGTTEERIVTLNGYEGDSLKLSADQIPAAGGKPDNGYTEGEWDTVPVTDIELTEDAVYTYIYAEETEVVKPEYYIVGSADAIVTEGDETDVEFTAKRSVDDEHCIDHHKDVILGGVTLKAGRDYSVRHGSTIVTINGSVIKNLKPGVYIVKIIFDDGAVTTNLTVKERTKETTTETVTETTTEVITEAATEATQKPVEKKTDKNAATGDDVNLWIALMMLSMSGTIAMFTVKKKKHK
ncbi:MAG: LPXTG cell wall anchor domain-containing protein [Eubacterium sp.]|nr:LPXTG cell wall anchor domain-containing protein [Eubacterium sp.]